MTQVQRYPDITFPEVRPGRVAQPVQELLVHERDRATVRKALVTRATVDNSQGMYANGQHIVSQILRGFDWSLRRFYSIYPAAKTERVEGDVDFMKVKIDYSLTQNVPERSRLPAHYDYVPVLELTGATREGRTVFCWVWGATPYFHVSCDTPMLFPDWPAEDLCHAVLWRLEKLLRHELDKTPKRRGEPNDDLPRYVHAVELVMRKSLYGYTEMDRSFLKISLVRPKDTPKARSFFHLNGQFCSIETGLCFKTFESNCEFVVRQMVDANVVGAGWITLPAGKYHVRGQSSTLAPLTECRVEVDVHFDDLVGHGRAENDDKYQQDAPLVVSSEDWEVVHSIPGRFPTASAEGDMMVQAAFWVCLFENGRYKKRHGCVFMVDPYPERTDPESLAHDPAYVGTDPVVCDDDTIVAGFAPDIYLFPDESTMLRTVSLYRRHIDADIVTGHNIIGFDFRYMLERTRALRIEDPANYIGRKICHKAYLQKQTFSSQAHGTTVNLWPVLGGPIVEDTLDHARKDFTLSVREYSLRVLSSEVLGYSKVDMPWQEITPAFWGTDTTRARLCMYVMVDAVLPIKIMETRAWLEAELAQARVSGVPIEFLRTKGQGAKTMALVIRAAKPRGYLLPNLNNADDRPFLHGKESKGPVRTRTATFQGATVLKPKRGFYEEDPVITLDFTSLYPSIMQAHGLAYSSWVPKQLRPFVEPDMWQESPSGDAFIKPSVFDSVVCELLRTVLGARGDAKTQMKNAWKEAARCKEEGDMGGYRAAVAKAKAWNGIQSALKIVANSTYGFLSAVIGRCPLVPGGRSVTGYGRQLIDTTKSVVEGEGVHLDVVYGDTDSVMIRVKSLGAQGFCTRQGKVDHCVDLGEDLAAVVNRGFPTPVNLAFEKVMFPFLLLKKKRYAGLMYEGKGAPTKINHKGTEVVRRDNFLLLKETMAKVIDLLFGYDSKNKELQEPDPDGAVGLIQETARAIQLNKVPLDKLVITKKYGRPMDAYKVPQPHLIMNAKLEARNPGSSYPLGARIPFVYIRGIEEKITHRAEDPAYVEANDLAVDSDYYLGQFIRSVLRIMTPVLAPSTNLDSSVIYKAVLEAEADNSEDEDDLVEEICDGDTIALDMANAAFSAREQQRTDKQQTRGYRESVQAFAELLDGNRELSEGDAVSKTYSILFTGQHMRTRHVTIPKNAPIIQAWGGNLGALLEAGKKRKIQDAQALPRTPVQRRRPAASGLLELDPEEQARRLSALRKRFK